MARTFRHSKDLPTWRRIALNAWRPPTDATIHGTMEIDATEVLDYVSKSRALGGPRITITHLVSKALADAIAQMPKVNGIVSRGKLMLRESVDIFIQVSLDKGESLSGATVRDADQKSLAEMATELDDQVSKIRSHTDETLEKTSNIMSKIPDRILGPLMRFLSWLQYDLGVDLSKLGVERDTFGSAMVTNVGMFAIEQGYAPIFPLGRTPMVIVVGEVVEKPVVIDGTIVARPMLGLHATMDHRIVDGYHIGVLASKVKDSLAKPEVAFGPVEKTS